MSLLVLVLASCDKDPIGETNGVALAGEWKVMIDALDASGNVVYEDYMGGYCDVITYNTNKDDNQEIWVNDLRSFWDYAVKVPCNIDNLTFGSTTPTENYKYECNVTIWDGKITPNGTVTPYGDVVTDAIEFKLSFDDDSDGFIYFVHGYRRTGLSGGEE